MLRRWHVAVLAVLCVFALACEEGAGATPRPTSTGTAKPKPGYPSSMAALGDSITAGYGSCAVYVACSRNSWSTGGADGVDSHYGRILAKNSKMKGKARDFAVPGADAADLKAQAASAVDAGSEYVTILIGANDACAGDVSGMTSVKTFRSQVDDGLDRLKKGLPKSRVLVVSIPDIYRLWELGHKDANAVRVWGRGICPSMLARPTSTADADDDRRHKVKDRVAAYNTQLEKACAAYGKRCRWDGGSANRVDFSLNLVSKFDYFHPNFDGQKRLADVTWPGKINW
ncbi:GDSL-type esterase/lipase family protein [Winogradskya humida]|uniref:Lipoprotein n=1 Tax=Winogradskya humida TaxID=113566 RepID=A0ABQ3ZJX2_9ACTN|nr:GDSL-type esterase/lipase family protein [Actinoplanes humidus]GIE18900.1 lipoprotein [Actinoplanes humidus]